MNKFWKWSNGVESTDSKLILEGVISSEDWWGDGLDVTPKALRDELAGRSGDLVVSLNSPGGDVFAGVSIYHTLSQYDKGTVTIEVSGLAASIASVIAMAGDKIIMLAGSSMMIHKPWTLGFGNADELEKVIDSLNSIEDSIIPIYTSRTSLSEEKIKEMLADETWLTPQEAVELGFADEYSEPKKKAGVSDSIKNALNGQFAFSMSATKQAMQKLVDKMKAEAEAENATDTEELDEAGESQEPPETPDESETVEETETEEVEVTEPTTEETSNSVEEENNMPKPEEIAKDQVIEAKNQAPVTPTPSVKDYLKTKESMEAFARVLEDQAGKSSDDVRAAWKEHLETKMGVTNPEIFLPEPLITSIEDAFKEGGEIWNRVTKTGADVWRATWDANTDPDAETGRAAGYNREDEEEKREQVLTFAARILRPQMVYKYITLNREDVKNQRSTGALVRFVLSELPRRIIREVERAIVLGDGRAPSSDYKIQEGTPEGFFPVVADAVAQNAFADLYIPVEGEDNYASVVRANDLLEADGGRVLITKKGYVTDMKLQTNANGGYIFPLGADFSSILEVDAIVQPDWFNDTSSPEVDAILVVLPNYRVVGDTSIEAFTNFLLKTNKQEYLQEIWAGGGLTVRKTAVAIGVSASS